MQRVFTPSRGLEFQILCPRGKKHGEAQWHRDHWKAMDARRGAWKHDQGSIAIRWQEGEKYRNSPKAHGWTEEYCRYLDYLDDRHLPNLTLAPQAPVREHHHIGMQ